MKLSEFNEYVQTVAALGAIVALLGVGYEIRQSNMIATRESLSANWTNAMQAEQANIEAGISKVRAKAMIGSEDLKLEELIDLDSYLLALVYDYHHNLIVLTVNNTPELVDIILREIEDDAAYFFGSRYSRAWYGENKPWIHPDIAAAIDRGLSDSPLGEDLAYYTRIQAAAAVLK